MHRRRRLLLAAPALLSAPLVLARSVGEVRRIGYLDDVLLIAEQARIAALATQHRIPAMYGFPGKNALVSYGVNWTEHLRRAAAYVARILKGATPAELPVEQPTRFELVIDLKAARGLGLKIPHSVLLRADRVIE